MPEGGPTTRAPEAPHTPTLVAAPPASPTAPRPPSPGAGASWRVPSGEWHREAGHPRWPVTALQGAAYLLLATFAYRQVLVSPTSRMPICACGDQAQEVWFLRWPLYALAHGLNPFLTTFMNVPAGANLTINTSAPLLGWVSAPLQLAVGSVATYDLLLVLAMAGSAFSMCMALRRYVRSRLAGFAGGLAYGFSPFAIGEGTGHLFLVAVFLPPLVLLVLDDLVLRQRHPAWRDGVALGALAAAQYLISPEVLAMTAVMGAVGVVVLGLARPRDVRAHLPHALGGLAWCAAVCVLALGYPIWLSVAGPDHVVGAPHPVALLDIYSGDLLGPLVPTLHQALAPAQLTTRGDALSGANPTENGMYLGLPLVVVLGVMAWTLRRCTRQRFFLAMAVAAGVLALGPRLVVDTHHTGVPLPFAVLVHLPFVQDILPVRFSLFEQLFAAAALAVGLEQVARMVGEHAGWPRWARPGIPVAVGVAALLPLVPALPYAGVATSVPAFYTSRAVARIPAGSTVLSYPYPSQPSEEETLLGQVAAGMRFKIIGSDAFVPGPSGTSMETPTPLRPYVVQRMFDVAFTAHTTMTPAHAGAPAPAVPPARPLPPLDRRTISALRTFLRRYHVSTVIVEPAGRDPAAVLRYVRAALGPGTVAGGVEAWFGVPHRLRDAPAEGRTG